MVILLKKKFSVGILLLGLLLIGIAYAADLNYGKYWSNEGSAQHDPRNANISFSYVVGDGYLYVSAFEEYAKYYNKKGDYIGELNYWIENIYAYKDKIYAFDVTFDITGLIKSYYKIIVYNDKLEKVNEISLPFIPEDKWSSSSSISLRMDGYDVCTEVDDKIIFYSLFGLLSVDFSTGESEILENNDENLKKYFPMIYMKVKEEKNSTKYYSSHASRNKYLAKSGSQANSQSRNNEAFLEIYRSGKLVETVVNADYNNFYNIELIHNLIVLIGTYSDISHYRVDKSDILVYDLEGNLKQTINLNSSFVGMNSYDKGFIVSRLYIEGICEYEHKKNSSSEVWKYDSCQTHLYHENYEYLGELLEIEFGGITPDTDYIPDKKPDDGVSPDDNTDGDKPENSEDYSDEKNDELLGDEETSINPDTTAKSIIILIVISIFSLITFIIVQKKKIKY